MAVFFRPPGEAPEHDGAFLDIAAEDGVEVVLGLPAGDEGVQLILLMPEASGISSISFVIATSGDMVATDAESAVSSCLRPPREKTLSTMPIYSTFLAAVSHEPLLSQSACYRHQCLSGG